MKEIIDRTVPPMVEGHFQCTIAPVVGEVVGAHVDRQLTDVFTAPDQSAFGVGPVDLIDSVLEKGLRALAVLGAVFGDPPAPPPFMFCQLVRNVPYKAS